MSSRLGALVVTGSVALTARSASSGTAGPGKTPSTPAPQSALVIPAWGNARVRAVCLETEESYSYERDGSPRELGDHVHPVHDGAPFSEAARRDVCLAFLDWFKPSSTLVDLACALGADGCGQTAAHLWNGGPGPGRQP